MIEKKKAEVAEPKVNRVKKMKIETTAPKIYANPFEAAKGGKAKVKNSPKPNESEQ